MTFLVRILFLLISSWLLPAEISATEISGTIKENTTWTIDMSPIIITENVMVPDSVSLDIDKGCQIKFDGYFTLTIKGRLQANGSETEPIVFTSNSDEPQQSDWNGLVFSGKRAGGFLNNCKVRYAFKNLIWKSNPSFTACFFSDNNYALYFSFSQGSKVVGSRFYKNNFGIYCDYSSPEIRENKIVENSYGVYCILSSAPIIGQNDITANVEKDIQLDETMGKNDKENINNHVWDLMKGLF